ncbi:hypothetical protein [Agromyces sp. S2-1-8]|uniref:hypothetical protein n=1 Tax=Agromyces sp. S2-1-8 TaxID=2897180 RepID=UPI001E2A4AEB|nr:hypothetical protein [Agromyces sp. S2-1-8]MCD5348432.1 hypothetical protein [Agromyces sp. S2-1-8]
MKLIPLPGSDGRPTLWVNPEHVTTVARLDQSTGEGVQLRAELKIEGMGLHRVNLGDHASAADADAAWQKFFDELVG